MIGRTRWAIAEGYIPAWSHGKEPEFAVWFVQLVNAVEAGAHDFFRVEHTAATP